MAMCHAQHHGGVVLKDEDNHHRECYHRGHSQYKDSCPRRCCGLRAMAVASPLEPAMMTAVHTATALAVVTVPMACRWCGVGAVVVPRAVAVAVGAAAAAAATACTLDVQDVGANAMCGRVGASPDGYAAAAAVDVAGDDGHHIDGGSGGGDDNGDAVMMTTEAEEALGQTAVTQTPAALQQTIQQDQRRAVLHVVAVAREMLGGSPVARLCPSSCIVQTVSTPTWTLISMESQWLGCTTFLS